MEICLSYVLFRVTGVNAQSDHAFLTCNKMICAIWLWVTVVQQNEYVPILAHGYLSSNKRKYE